MQSMLFIRESQLRIKILHGLCKKEKKSNQHSFSRHIARCPDIFLSVHICILYLSAARSLALTSSEMYLSSERNFERIWSPVAFKGISPTQSAPNERDDRKPPQS